MYSESPPVASSLMDRMWRAAKLDPELYEEVEADKGSLGQATTVVVLSALAAGLGNLHYGGLGMLVLGTLAALLGWYIWAFLTYFIGTRLLPTAETEADHKELLRTTGFSAAPGLIRVLGLVPGLADAVFAIAGVWMLIAMVISVRQALDYTSTWRALAVCFLGWLVQGAILLLIISAFGLPEGQ
ncbi:MAG: YIP1 family protein [Myxococcota bacterium]|nr:YIP1 family protein [Myxococcota bacterium]